MYTMILDGEYPNDRQKLIKKLKDDKAGINSKM